jgi:hypothetical protein
MSELRDLLTPVSALLAELNLDDPAAVEAALVERFPPDGEAFATIAAAARAVLAAGTICDRGEAPVRFSRIAKPEEDPHGFSVDAVLLERTAGPRHTHPRGEISLCLVEEASRPSRAGRTRPGSRWRRDRATSRRARAARSCSSTGGRAARWSGSSERRPRTTTACEHFGRIRPLSGPLERAGPGRYPALGDHPGSAPMLRASSALLFVPHRQCPSCPGSARGAPTRVGRTVHPRHPARARTRR